MFGLIELARAIFTRVRNIYLGLVRTDLNVEKMSEVYDERVHYRGSLDEISHEVAVVLKSKELDLL